MENRTDYTSVHIALSRKRGKASARDCVDCHRPARDWSYDHKDPNEIRCETGEFYSLNPDHYEARCRSCHLKFDKEHRISVARELLPHVKYAVALRNRARRRNDIESEDFWDDRLDWLMTLLRDRITVPRL